MVPIPGRETSLTWYGICWMIFESIQYLLYNYRQRNNPATLSLFTCSVRTWSSSGKQSEAITSAISTPGQIHLVSSILEPHGSCAMATMGALLESYGSVETVPLPLPLTTQMCCQAAGTPPLPTPSLGPIHISPSEHIAQTFNTSRHLGLPQKKILAVC